MAHEHLSAEEVSELSAADAVKLNILRATDLKRREIKNAKFTTDYRAQIAKHKAILSNDPGNVKSKAKIAKYEEGLRNIAVHRHPMGAYTPPTLKDANIQY